MSQSSNDVISNTIRITTLKLVKELYSELKKLEVGFEKKADEFKDIRKSARTHTQDAVPITFGQEMKAYSEAVVHGRERIEESTENLSKLFLGGTAVGTGLNTHPEYSKSLLEHVKELTGLELSLAENFIEKTQFTSDFLHFMNSLTSLCVDLVKICNDLMIYSSGPCTGLREIVLPAVEPGSSIMPGKINPSILECVNMVLFQLIGRRTVIENVSQFGMMDLNVYTPVIAYNIFNSIKWLKKAIHILVKDCIEGLKVNREVTNYYFNHSNAMATILSPFIGYEKAALLAKEALIRDVPVKTLVIEEGLLTKDEIEELILSSFEPNLNVVNKIVEKRGENPFDK
jgi:aspartate ammonia-lyase